jgi:hypothetical protein
VLFVVVIVFGKSFIKIVVEEALLAFAEEAALKKAGHDTSQVTEEHKHLQKNLVWSGLSVLLWTICGGFIALVGIWVSRGPILIGAVGLATVLYHVIAGILLFLLMCDPSFPRFPASGLLLNISAILGTIVFLALVFYIRPELTTTETIATMSTSWVVFFLSMGMFVHFARKIKAGKRPPTWGTAIADIVGELALSLGTYMIIRYLFLSEDHMDNRDRPLVRQSTALMACSDLLYGLDTLQTRELDATRGVWVMRNDTHEVCGAAGMQIVSDTNDTITGVNDANAAICEYHSGDQLVVAVTFRGSESTEDFRTDFTLFSWSDSFCLTGDGPTGRVHAGFAKQLRSVLPRAFALLGKYDWTGPNPPRLIFTGHSLGGALATLAAYWHKCGKVSGEHASLDDSVDSVNVTNVPAGQLVTFGGARALTNVTTLQNVLPPQDRVRVVARYNGEAVDDLVTLSPPGYANPDDDLVLLRPDITPYLDDTAPDGSDNPPTDFARAYLHLHTSAYRDTLYSNETACPTLDDVCLCPAATAS